MAHRIFQLGVVSIIALAATAALAAVEVRFIEPDKYADVREFGRDREQLFKEIEAHLSRLGDKQLAGKHLLVEVTDLDRAGELEPRGSGMREIRVLRAITRPAITLRYVVSQGGTELRRGEAWVSDLSYLDRFNRYASSDAIRYEKRMLDDWFATEFAAPETQ